MSSHFFPRISKSSMPLSSRWSLLPYYLNTMNLENMNRFTKKWGGRYLFPEGNSPISITFQNFKPLSFGLSRTQVQRKSSVVLHAPRPDRSSSNKVILRQIGHHQAWVHPSSMVWFHRSSYFPITTDFLPLLTSTSKVEPL